MKKKRNKFANAVIFICIAALMYMTLATIQGYREIGVPVPSDVVREFRIAWITELGLVALRQILGSDIVGKAKSNNMEE